MQVTELCRYPVKSLGGGVVDTLEIEPWGPAGDRRWAVTDPQGRLVTARTVHELLTVRAAPRNGGVEVTSATGDSVTVDEPVGGPVIEVNVSRVPTAIDAGDDVADLLSDVCGRELRMIWQPDPRRRSVNPRNGGLDGEMLSLADAGPILLTTTASLDRLQQWIGEAPTIEMDRFRPNVVVEGASPFEEDHWRSVRIGDIDFRVQERCDRCMMTTIDPVTVERGDEPMLTLRRHHSRDGEVYFGVRLVPLTTGSIAIGDRVVPTPPSGPDPR